MVRSDVHGMRDGDGGTRGPQRGARRIDFAEVFEAGPGRDEANSTEPGSRDPSATATIIGAATAIVDATAACSVDASKAVSFRFGGSVAGLLCQNGSEALPSISKGALPEEGAAFTMKFLPLCGRGGTGRRTSLRGWR